MLAYREARQKKGLPARPDDRIERVLTLMVNMALTRWEALLAQEEERAAGPSTVRPRESGDPTLYSEKESTGFPLARE